MNEQREREVLSDLQTEFGTRLIGRRRAEGEGWQSTVRGLRLIAEECEIDVDATGLAVLAALGPVVEQTANSVSVILKGGWLRMNPVVVTCTLQGSGSGQLRAAALEGKISNRSAERLLPK